MSSRRHLQADSATFIRHIVEAALMMTGPWLSIDESRVDSFIMGTIDEPNWARTTEHLEGWSVHFSVGMVVGACGTSI